MRGIADSKIASMNVEVKIEHLSNYLPTVVRQVCDKPSGAFTPEAAKTCVSALPILPLVKADAICSLA